MHETAMLEYQAHIESNARTYAPAIHAVLEQGQVAKFYTAEGRCLSDCLAGAEASQPWQR